MASATLADDVPGRSAYTLEALVGGISGRHAWWPKVADPAIEAELFLDKTSLPVPQMLSLAGRLPRSLLNLLSINDGLRLYSVTPAHAAVLPCSRLPWQLQHGQAQGANPANAYFTSMHHEADWIFRAFSRMPSLFFWALQIFRSQKS